jgi:hypothetical protein
MIGNIAFYVDDNIAFYVRRKKVNSTRSITRHGSPFLLRNVSWSTSSTRSLFFSRIGKSGFASRSLRSVVTETFLKSEIEVGGGVVFGAPVSARNP